MGENGDFRIRLAGRGAPDDMGPGDYLARCIRAEIKRRGNQTRVVLTYRVENGRFDGVLLHQWIAVCEHVAAHHKLARAYRTAIGRELELDEELSLAAFVDKLYIVHAGFRMTNGKRFAAEDSRKRKDDKDFLRVHDLVSLVDSATAASDNSEQPSTQTRKARRLVKLSSRRRAQESDE